jgi:hypothetical protein
VPELTPGQTQELHLLLDGAARPEQQAVVPTLHRLVAIDPQTGRKAATAVLLELIRDGDTSLRAAFAVLSRLLAGNTLPHGQIVAVGSVADAPLMVLARDVLQLHLQGDSAKAWTLLEAEHVARRAAVLSYLAALLHYDITGVDPATL